MNENQIEDLNLEIQEPEVKIPDGSGYEKLVKDSEGSMRGEVLEKLYPELIDYLNRHKQEPQTSKFYERAIEELNSGNETVIKALVGFLEQELTSSKYRDQNRKALMKDKNLYPDPRHPDNKFRKVSALERFRLLNGEKIALLKNSKVALGLKDLNGRPQPGVDYRAEVAVSLNDLGIALKKNPLKGAALITPFRKAG